jgi:hypothetical protein
MSTAEERAPRKFSGYGFTFAIPGKFYGGREEVGDHSGPRVHAWAPLFNFTWQGEGFEVAKDVLVVPGASYKGYELDVARQFLSLEEIDECRGAGHYLQVRQALRDEISISVRMNSFLLALWITRPTRTHVTHRFVEVEEGESTVVRLLDRFQWIEGYIDDEISTTDLERVRAILQPIVDLYSTSRRLRNALVLTFRGCVATDWQSSFICLTAAAEALLTHSQGPGLVHRLADAFARLMARTDSERKIQRDHFKLLYATRSKIMHGRAHDRRTAEDNLRELAALRDALRALWGRILDSQDIRTALDADDKSRVNLLNAL